MIEDFTSLGLSATIRGEDTIELKKLKGQLKEPITLPEELAEVDAAVKLNLAIKNSEIRQQNKIIDEEYQSRKIEILTRISSRLMGSMRTTAPIALKTLMDKHQVRNSDGNLIPDVYDGAAVFQEIRAGLTENINEYELLKYQKAYEYLRDNKLANNTTPQKYSARINLFLVHINPYLQPPMQGTV